ncbi:MAG: hypothetical protein ABIS50_10545 [Luteolibacter sp.]|uniref:HEAT repeat domain-containing protein n=1 Tax=Luteolibacter sp. TaxID=1962973 RepID=UPI0032673EA0
MKHTPYPAFLLGVMLAGGVGAQEKPLLTYQWQGGHSPYKQVRVVISQTGDATVSWQRHEPPVLEYQTTLSAEELGAVQAMIRSTDFFEQSGETPVILRDAGETEFSIESGGKGKTLKYLSLPALAPMEGMIGKLTAQAFAMQAIESDGDIGAAACAVSPPLAGGKALQPGVLKKPLMTYVRGRHTRQKVQCALEALSYVTTPEEYCGFISMGLDDWLQRETLLSIIGSRPFCGNIPDAHLESLCPIYLSYVRGTASREAELTQTEKEALSSFTDLLGESRYEPAIPVLLKWFEAHDRPGATASLTPIAKMGEAGLAVLIPYLDSPNENYRINAIELLAITSRLGPHAGFSHPLTEYQYEKMIPIFVDKAIPRLRELAVNDPSKLVRKRAEETLAEIRKRVEKERIPTGR